MLRNARNLVERVIRQGRSRRDSSRRSRRDAGRSRRGAGRSLAPPLRGPGVAILRIKQEWWNSYGYWNYTNQKKGRD